MIAIWQPAEFRSAVRSYLTTQLGETPATRPKPVLQPPRKPFGVEGGAHVSSRHPLLLRLVTCQPFGIGCGAHVSYS